MSDATKAALEAALQAHVADEMDDGFVSGYVTKIHVVRMSGNDGSSHYLFVKPDQQAYHETYGLLMTASDDFVNSSIEGDDD